MYDKFGVFDSADEINRAAAAQKAQGDEEAVYGIAKENGIDQEDVHDYLDGVINELVSEQTAAIGRIEVEEKEFGLKGILADWADEIIDLVYSMPGMAAAVRRKDKGLDGYIAALAEYGYENRVTVDKRIVEKAPSCKRVCGGHEFAIGVPGKKERKNIAVEYYIGGAK